MILLATLSLCAVAQGNAAFSNQTTAAGLQFTHQQATDHPADIMSAGGAVGDFNNDGWPDLFVIGGGIHDQLFLNNGDGTFREEGHAWGLTAKHRGTGAAVGDFDKDGWDDVYVTSFGPISFTPIDGQHRLYRNTGNQSFVEVAVSAGVNATSVIPDGFSPAFGDYDRDGDLDLFVAGWFYYGGGNHLFQNNGDGTFTKVTTAAGIFNRDTLGFAPRFIDLDGDRFPEILLAADFGTTRIYANQRDGTFTDRSDVLFTNYVYNGMGSAVADFNVDGYLDWFITSIFFDTYQGTPNGNRLYWGGPSLSFTAAPKSAGVNDGGWGWGTDAIDVDHDGWVDIVETNGWSVDPQWMVENAYLYRNNGDGTFTDIAENCGFRHRRQGRGLVTLDYDQDGDMDVVIFSHNDKLALLRNDVPNAADTHWLQVELDTSAHPGLPPHGMGSKVHATVAGRTQLESMDGGATYLGTSELIAHFGLGSSTVVDEVRVEWPDGFVTVLTDVPVDQRLKIGPAPPLQHGPLVRSQPVDFRVQGALPGEFVIFLYSFAGAGLGVRKDNLLGGRHLGLLEPVQVLGSQSADSQGEAVLSLLVPANAPLTAISCQAVIARGLFGAQSALSNVSTTVIQP